MNARAKDIFREIKKSLGRFMSILLIIAVGVGFFVGVKATAPSMYQTAENYFNRQHLMDVEILSTVGFSDEDAEKVRELEKVDQVMPAYSADLMLKYGNEMLVTKLMSMPLENTDFLNQPVVLQGRLPQAEDECLITYDDEDELLYHIGDTMEFESVSGGTNVDTILKQRKFTVVGVVELPQYISYSYGTSSIGSGSVTMAVMIPQSNFLYSRYTELYVTFNCHNQGMTAFEDEYDTVLKDIKVELENLGKIQYHKFVQDSEKQIDDAQSEYDKGQKQADKELKAALSKLTEIKQQIDDGVNQIKQGWVDYEAGSKDAARQIKDAEEQIAQAKLDLEEGEIQLATGQEEYDKYTAEAKKELDDARAELDAQWEVYNEGKSEYDAAMLEYETLYQEYQDGLTEYNSYLEEYDSALSTYNEVSAIVLELETQLAELEMEDTEVSDESVSILQEGLTYAQQMLESYTTELESTDTESEDYEDLAYWIEFFTGEVVHYEEKLTEINERENNIVKKQDLEDEITRAKATLETTNTELETAKEELDAARQELDEAEAGFAELEQAELELAEGYAELEAYESEYNEEKKNAEDQILQAQKELEEGMLALEEARIEIDNAEIELADRRTEVDQELQDAYKELTSSEAELEDAKEEYEDGLQEYNEAVKEAEDELSSGLNRIQNARRELKDVVSGKWYVLSRDEIIVSYTNFKSDAKRINAIADVFPVFFLLVAALVCLTTMSRMIDEQRIQMGTYKALGYRPREIVAKYLIYAALACIGGCIIGPIICVEILPRVIFGAYTALYTLPDFTVTMPFKMLAISVVVAMLCTILVALICCWKELRSTTAALMRPKAPKAGKKILLERIPFLWNRFTFFQKLTARNLFRYKVRLLMTVIGIAGCMALVVAGFGLQNAIAPIIELQYGELTHDDVTLSLDQSYKFDDVRELMDSLKADERLKDCMLTYGTECKVYNISETQSLDETYLFMPQNVEDTIPLLTLRAPHSHQAVSWSDDGVIITEKIARLFNVDTGDQITIMIGEKKYTMQVADVVENYVYNNIYITPTYYKQVFGKSPVFNSIYASHSEKMTDRDAFSTECLSKYEKIIMVYYTDEIQDSIDDTLSSMNIVVVVMILCAGILAFIVLYNLTNINLSERLREIATVKVLGFRNMETNMYIFRENIIMCILGILLGSVLGYLMAQYLINTVEVSVVTFNRDIKIMSYVYSAGITLLFTILVNIVMAKRIKEISMVESLKAIE